MQTITYPNSEDIMIEIQDDGSIYHYNQKGKKTTKIEQNRTVLLDADENVLFEVQGGEAGASQIILGYGSTKISINEQEGEINITGTLIVNGVTIG